MTDIDDIKWAIDNIFTALNGLENVDMHRKYIFGIKNSLLEDIKLQKELIIIRHCS